MAFDNLSDAEFVSAFENCTLDAAAFHHIDHLRLARIYVEEYGQELAGQRLLTGICKFATHAGAPRKFHYTATIAWVKLVGGACAKENAAAPFADWIENNAELLNTRLPLRHYTQERFDSEQAKTSWIEPDLLPL
jgi:hypothetical protein